MDTGPVDDDDEAPTGRAHDVTIVFGPASVRPATAKANIRATCEAIGLPRSTYYYQSHRSLTAIVLEQKIVLRLHELRDSYPHDGYRRMTEQLRREGFLVNRKRIARLIQLHGLTTQSARARAGTPRDPQLHALPTLSRNSGRGTGTRQAWLSDIAYVHTQAGLIYVAVVIDVGSREIVAYAFSHRTGKNLSSFALHSAVCARRPAYGCIHHSTCGSQYFMRGHRKLLKQYGLTPSTSDSQSPSALQPGSRIVDLQGYEMWEDVVRQPADFVRTAYSRARIDSILCQLALGNDERTVTPYRESPPRPALRSRLATQLAGEVF